MLRFTQWRGDAQDRLVGEEDRSFGHRVDIAFYASGQPALIGDSMGTASYVLVGTSRGMGAAFGSACHGAVRSMSRNEASRPGVAGRSSTSCLGAGSPSAARRSAALRRRHQVPTRTWPRSSTPILPVLRAKWPG
jgi:hypothetical protein